MRLGRMSRALVNVVVIATTLVLRAGAAFAQSYPGGNQTPPPTAVKGQRLFRGPNPADTGTNILLFILLALLALVIGLYLHRISRRRADGHAD